MRRLRDCLFVRGGRKAAFFGLMVCAAFAVSRALAQPANDNFANAITLNTSAGWGSISNDSTGATAEFGEPTHAGFPASATVWYKWVAPQTGEVEVDTIGSSFDTVLAVYTGNSLGTLAQVAANDDLFVSIALPGTGQIAQLNLAAQAVDTTNLPPLPASITIGPFSPPPPPLNFGNLSVSLNQPFTGLPYNFLTPGSGVSGLRFNAQAGATYYLVVGGKQGLSGPYSLNWAFHPSGVFRFASENRDATTGHPGMLLYQVAESEDTGLRGGLINANQFNSTVHTVYNYQVNGLLVTITRVAGSAGQVVVGYSTIDGDQLSDHYTWDTNNGVLVSDGNPLALNGDASATALLDYLPETGILTFNDFEMSKTIIIPIFDDGGFVEHNRDFGVVLFDPQLGPSESSVVSQPRLDVNDYQALVRILDLDIDPRGPARTPDGPLTNVITVGTGTNAVVTTNIYTNIVVTLPGTNAVFNFMKSNYRIPEDVSDYWGNTPITVYVNRSGTNSAAASCLYRIDSTYLDNSGGGLLGNNEFTLEPGSDYATPPNGKGVVGGVIQNDPADFTGASSGTLSWGANNFDPQPITFNINNDTVTEFNEDFRIDLYEMYAPPQGPPFPRPVGMVGETTVTIMFDDNDPPAGSVDEYYNPDFASDIIPQVGQPALGTTPRQYPGTDPGSQVNALVVQTNDLTIIGGDFVTYNGATVNGIVRIDTTGELDPSFNPGAGINVGGGDFISSLAVQEDGKVLVAGSFTAFAGQPCGNVVRLNTDGTVDTSFRLNTGSGANGTIRSLFLRDDGKIVIGGDFTLFNGTSEKYIARLNSDGSLDTTYNTGNALNGSVYALGPTPGSLTNFTVTATGNELTYTNIVNVGWPSGRVTISYDMMGITNDMMVIYGSLANGFVIFNTGPVTNAAQVTIPFGPINGQSFNTIEIVFNLGNTNTGLLWSFNATVKGFGGYPMAIGGDFTSVNGVFGQDHITRLFDDGSVDTSFDPGGGANARVRAILIQKDDRMVVAGGDFTSVNGQPAGHIVRLTTNGAVDPGFFAGTGTDGNVFHLHRVPTMIITNNIGGTNIVFTTNLQALYVGGPFSVYNGTHRLGFARLNMDGSLDTTFLDTAYNQFAGLPRLNYGDRFNAVLASDVQSDGKVMIGGSFGQVGGGQFDPSIRPEPNNPYAYTEPKQRTGVRNRVNVARLIGGATPGPGNVGLLNSSYPAAKSQGFVYGLLMRTNGFLGYGSANFSVLPGTSVAGQDFSYYAGAPIYPVLWEYSGPSRMHSDGAFGTNTVMNTPFGGWWSLGFDGMASVIVNVSPNANGSGHAQFQLANPGGVDQFYLGGENVPLGVALGRSVAPLSIQDDSRQLGTFGFTSSFYISSSNAVISVIRTNGIFNSSPVQVDYATSAGSNTVSGVDYFDVSGTLTFNSGETLKTFTVPIVQSNYISAIEKTVNLRLLNFPAGASIGLSNAVLRIINPNFQGFLNFDSTNYVTNLSAGAVQVTVTRNVGSKGTLDVQCVTSNGTAAAGTDFVATATSLHWDNGDASSRPVSIPLINNGGLGGLKMFFVNLLNPLLNGSPAPAVLGAVTNATVTINNDNNYGVYEFSSPSYVVNEATNGYATITVIRTVSSMGSTTVGFSTANGTALAGINYVATNGTLSFAPGQLAQTFSVRVLDDGLTNGLPFYFNVVLANPGTGALLGSPTNAQVNILDAQQFNRPPGNGDVTFDEAGLNSDVLAIGLQSDGKIVAGGNFTTVNGLPRNHYARFNGDGTLDTTFENGLSGADGSIYALAIQSDDNILVGGAFATVDGVARTRIARVAPDGTLDPSFNAGAGADGSVFSIVEAFGGTTRQIYVGGAFTLFEGNPHPGIVRLVNNGLVDTSFTSTGVNGIVYAIAVYPTNSIYAGKLLIGGSFTTVNGINQTNVARLNADGTLDTNFVVNADGIVRALAIQNDDATVIGGEFQTVNGVSANRVVRVNPNGAVDTAFASAVAPGMADVVDAIAIQADNRIVLGGQFTVANNLNRHHITRLLPSGAADPTINFGDAANGDVDAIAIQPGDQMIVLGGGFTQFNFLPAPYLTRVYGGSMTGSGAFQFTSAAYQVNENGGQAAITIWRVGGAAGTNADGSGNVTVQFTTTPDTAVPNTNYTSVSTTVSFPPGEVLETVFVPVIDDHVITTNLTVDMALSNPSASTVLGDQTNAVLTIVNTDSAISFSSPNFQVAKNVPTGVASITIVRAGGTTDTQTVGFATTTNGTAIAGADYTPTNAVVTFNPGDISKTVNVGVFNNGLVEGDRTVTMVISNILNATLASPSNAVLTIKDTTFSPGQLSFAATNFLANEGDVSANITVIRTGGSSGTVSAFYYTTPGTAVPGLNYISVSNTVSFSDGQTNRVVTVPLIDNSLAQGTVTLTVSLATNANSGTTLVNPTNTTVYIADNDSGFAFVNQTNTVLETAGQVSVNVIRIGPTNFTSTVNYATHDLTAVAPTNYTAQSGTLTFGPGQTLKSLVIPIVDDPAVTGDLLFTVVLSTNSGSLGAQLAFPSTNTVVIHDSDAGLSFTNASMIVRRDSGQAIVTVICNNPSVEPAPGDTNTPPLSVQYTTVDGTAIAGVDYIAVSGTMSFTNGNGTNIFIVPIINNISAQGERDFNVRLLNPTPPGRLVAPSNQVIQIVDGSAGFKFSKANYSVNKTDGIATINVFRSGLTDSLASVSFLATNGSAIDGTHYISTNGTLVFTNGVTNQTFAVQILDTTTVQPNKTVLLELLSPSNSVLSTPSAATLTIKDNTGSFVVPAGSALISESGAGAPNGIIDSNETVTVLFAFRDAGGLNVGNLVATLIATNGVTPTPNPEPQTYGPLVAGSHSVSRPFTFTAHGTNGQQIVATFQLQDGTTNIGMAVVGYQLGLLTSYFTNNAAILIDDHAIASPYPSTINVSNVDGTVMKTTIMLTNVAHSSPADIDALLVSPDKQTTLFMAHAGGQNAITNVNLTFDDAATNKLPQSGQIISGTNQPSAYLPVPVFP